MSGEVTEQGRHVWRIAFLFALGLGWPAAAWGLDYVQIRRDGREMKVAGQLLLEAQDGGLMLLAPDGEIWAIQPDEQIDHHQDDEAFEPLSSEALGRKLLAGLPPGFEMHRTSHYVILYGTSREYAQWCGSLFERLYRAFTNYWSKKGFALSEPMFPLVAIVFPDRPSYVQYARTEAGDAAKSIIGYFSLKTNRMTMYDLSNGGGSVRARRGSTSAQINQILSQPEAAWNVATIVHEATHQIAFNCGLHTRFSDCPRWFSEGIAMYFETPDLSRGEGWSKIGVVNKPRLVQFQQYVGSRKRPANSLSTLLTNDKRFLDTSVSSDAYAEAWALTYFLLHRYPKQYVAYLKALSSKKPMVWDEAAARLNDFKAAFGEEIETIDRELVNYVMRGR